MKLGIKHSLDIQAQVPNNLRQTSRLQSSSNCSSRDELRNGLEEEERLFRVPTSSWASLDVAVPHYSKEEMYGAGETWSDDAES